MSLTEEFRPRTYEDLIGQDKAQRLLKAWLTKGPIPHAVLFSGPYSSGKTTCAYVLARGLLCTNRQDAKPCMACRPCLDFERGVKIDMIEMDSAQDRGIDAIRELTSDVDNLPMYSKYRVIFLDEVHQCTGTALQALLKSLEQPPDHVVFMLATTNPEKLPEAVRSRCQEVKLNPISVEDCNSILQRAADAKGLGDQGITPDHLEHISRAVQAHPRSALHALEQVMALIDSAADTGQAVDESAIADFVRQTAKDDVSAAATKIVKAILSGNLSQAFRVVDDNRQELDVLFPRILETARQATRRVAAPQTADDYFRSLDSATLIDAVKTQKGDLRLSALKCVVDFYGQLCTLRVQTAGHAVPIADLIDNTLLSTARETKETLRRIKVANEALTQTQPEMPGPHEEANSQQTPSALSKKIEPSVRDPRIEVRNMVTPSVAKVRQTQENQGEV